MNNPKLKPNLRLLKPNLNIHSEDKKIEIQEDPYSQPDEIQQRNERIISQKPFRPPSSRKEDVKQFQRLDESIEDTKQDETTKVASMRRTPLNGFRKFNPQTQNINLEDNTSITQFNGPAINLFANKEKIEKKVQEIQQQELRQKLQVKIQSKPLNQIDEPEPNIFQQPPPKPSQRPKQVKVKQEEIIEKKVETIKVSELLNEQSQREQFKSTKEIIQEQQQQQQQHQQQQQSTKTSKKQTKRKENEQVQIQNPVPIETQIEDQSQMAQSQQIPAQIAEYKEKTIPRFNVSQSQISLGRKEQLIERFQSLRQIVSLEIDEYPNQMAIQPRTPFETYLNLIRATVYKNQCEQAFDDKLNVETQANMETNDFGNQCPEDFHKTFLQKQQQNTSRLAEFIEYACEVVEEIINVNKEEQKIQDDYQIPTQIVSKTKCIPVYTGFRETSDKIYQICYIKAEGSIIICQPESILLFTNSQITTVCCSQDFIIGGTSDGHIVGWNLQSKSLNQRLFKKFELEVINVSFSTEWNSNILDPFQDCIINSAIHQISINGMLIHSMDIFGQIQLYQLQELRFDESDKLFVDIGIKQKYRLLHLDLIQKGQQQIYNFMRLYQDNILICGPNKVVNISTQKSYYDDLLSTPLCISQVLHHQFFVGYADGNIRLFYKDCSNSIHQFRGSFTNIKFIQIIQERNILFIDKDCVLKIYDLEEEIIYHEQEMGKTNWEFSDCLLNQNIFHLIIKQNNEINRVRVFLKFKNLESNHLKNKLELYEGF